MMTSPTFDAVLIALSTVSLNGLVSEVEISEYRGTLAVDLPHETILRDEIVLATIEVTNLGDEELVMLEAPSIDGLQLKWIPTTEEKSEQSLGELLESVETSESPADMFPALNLDNYSSTSFDRNETGRSQRVALRGLLRALPHGEDVVFLRPVFHGGGGRVILGDAVKLAVILKNLTEFPVVLSSDFETDPGARFPFIVYEVEIAGERFLFNNTGVRFCRVPPGVAYRLSFDRAGPRLATTVEFDNPSLQHHIFNWRNYELVSASPETVPWLFATGSSSPREGGAPGGAQAENSESSGAADAEAESDEVQGSPWWPWLAAALIVLGLGTIWWWGRRSP